MINLFIAVLLESIDDEDGDDGDAADAGDDSRAAEKGDLGAPRVFHDAVSDSDDDANDIPLVEGTLAARRALPGAVVVRSTKRAMAANERRWAHFWFWFLEQAPDADDVIDVDAARRQRIPVRRVFANSAGPVEEPDPIEWRRRRRPGRAFGVFAGNHPLRRAAVAAVAAPAAEWVVLFVIVVSSVFVALDHPRVSPELVRKEEF